MNIKINRIDFESSFCDKRLSQRMVKILNDMMEKGTSVINDFSGNKASLIGAYRFYSNPRWELEDFTVPVVEYSCRSLEGTRFVGCIQDTCELNFGSTALRFSRSDKDLGPAGNNVDYGFFIHPTLLVSLDTGLPLGFSEISVYNRSWDKMNKYVRGYKKLPLKSKESFQWLRAALEASKHLPPDVFKVMLGDRESDIYESMWRTIKAGCSFVYRVRVDRRCQSGKLFESLKSEPVREVYDLLLPRSGNRKSRVAKMALRYSQAAIVRSATCLNGEAPSSMTLNYIYVEEVPESVPDGEKPIVWRLQTNMPIRNTDDAKLYIEWYKKRWLIEELFRIVKSEGFRLEDAALSSGMALKKLAVVTLYAALSALLLKRAMTEKGGQIGCGEYFDEEMVKVLEICQHKYDTKEKVTKARGNRNRKFSLAWAAWIIARLGGWTGYDKTPPGYIRMKNGLDRFFDRYEFFLQMIKFNNDV